MTAADVGDPGARFELLHDPVERRKPGGDQVRVVAGPEEALATVEDVVVVLVPADAVAAARRLGDARRVGDRVEDNLNPVGRAYYGFSTLLCTPASLSQEVGLALGAQAGEARIRDVVTTGGLTRFRRAAETPFNLVFEARP